MSPLLPLAMITLALTACGTSTSARAPYSAVGSWSFEVNPDGTSVWNSVGTVKFVAQDAHGAIEGLYTLANGIDTGRAVGDVNSGDVAIILGLNIVAIKGKFNGNAYSGRYETAFAAGRNSIGRARMRR